MLRSARSASFLGVLAIGAACAPTPTSATTARTIAAPISAPPSSSSPQVVDPNAPAARPIAVIAKILTRSGPPGGWDATRLWLLSYDENDGAVDLLCGMRDPADVAEFLKRLASSPTFSDVTLLRSTHDDAHEIQAEIVAKVPANGRLRITPATKSGIDFGKGNRDPFVGLRTPPAPSPSPQIAGDSDLDELTLIRIVSGDSPRAMLTDRAEKSWIVKVGDQVGRSDANAGCNWRVAEVKSSTVVMTRADATACNTKPLEQVFRLAKKKP